MVKPPSINEDQCIKDLWAYSRQVCDQHVEGQQQSVGSRFSRNGWIVDSCMWTGYSPVYGSWLDPKTINKGPLGLIVMYV